MSIIKILYGVRLTDELREAFKTLKRNRLKINIRKDMNPLGNHPLTARTPDELSIITLISLHNFTSSRQSFARTKSSTTVSNITLDSSITTFIANPT